MNRGARRTRLASGGLIAALGVVLAAIVVYDIYTDAVVQAEPLYTTLLENSVPMAVNAAIVAAGYWLARNEDRVVVRRTVVWTAISVAGLLAVALWVYGFQFLQGEIKPLIILAQIASLGAMAGIIVGIHSGRQKRRQRRLEALYENSSDLMAAETPTAVARCGIEAVENTLGLSIAAVFLESDGALEPIATSDRADELFGDIDAIDDETTAWRVYESEEPAYTAEHSRAVRTDGGSASIAEELIVPLPGHGVLSIAVCGDESFDREDRTLARVLGGNIGAALERVDREQTLRERERDLAEQNERLESFTSVVSHDLRNPLSVAEGYTEIAKEEADIEAIEGIDGALDRMDTLIDDLLTMARQGETIDERERVSLESLAREAWNTVETNEATLRVEGDGHLSADRNRCRQLLENLFRNSVEHGGEDVTVTVGPLGDDGFFVEDDGPGIDPDDREQVFEQGYTTAETGTGFGLAIVAEIVDAHGGDVSVTEGEDGGARFEIEAIGTA